MRSVILLAASTALLVQAASAQIQTPPKSPRSVVRQEIGFGEVTLDYGRPSVRGREIFGEMIPNDQIWRTGANECTKVTFSEDAEVGGEAVKAGTYSLYTIPGGDKWAFILNKNTKNWGANGYDPGDDILRIETERKALGDLRETLTIEFQGLTPSGGDLVIAWEHSQIQIPVKVDIDTKILADIDEQVRKAKGEVSARSYRAAAMFLFEREENLDEVEMWIDKAAELEPQAFWVAYDQARVAKHLGKADKAREVATKGLEAAMKSKRGDFGYKARFEAFLKDLG